MEPSKVILFRAKDISAQDAKKSHLKIFTLWFIYTTIKDIFIILVIIHNTPKVQLRAKNSCYIGCLVSILN